MNLEQLRKKYVDEGYTMANASAKICQDIILNKISKSTMNHNVTIKGGVVMHGISNDKRRTTRDLDLDFIRYSLSDEDIKRFIEKLKSLLKFGITSTRYKDIFDFYYLINNTKMNKDEIMKILNILIINDDEMRENNISDIIRDLKNVLNNKQYISRLSDAKNNWLELPVEDVIDSVIAYFEQLEMLEV